MNAAVTSVAILLLEDSAIDAELIHSHLIKGELDFSLRIATRRSEFESMLGDGGFELILADFALPDFDGLAALQLAQKLAPVIPFIFVSGVVGEDFATEAMRRGAVDYVVKRSLSRLPTAVRRAVAEAREREELRRAEAALRESQFETQVAMEAAQLGYWNFNPLTGQLVWDARVRELFGVEDTTPIDYQAFLRGCHPDDRERMHGLVAAAMAPGGSGRIVADYRLSVAGGERWVATYGKATFDNNVCTRLLGVLQDITDTKRTEARLRRLNESLEAQVEQRTQERDRMWRLSQDLMAVFTPEGQLLATNPAWEWLLGWPEKVLLDRRFHELMHPDDIAATVAEMRDLDGVKPTIRIDNRFRSRDGDYRWIRWTASFADELFYATGRDVTEERAAADALAASNQMLIAQISERERVEATLRQMQRLEAVGQLTSGIAHDFNNLLTVILGGLQSLERAALDEALQRRLQVMRNAAESGARLTSQLLAFSRRQRLSPKSLNLNDTIAHLHTLLASTMGASVEVLLRPSPALWSALVDPTQIELAILNLALNARDAMPEGGRLTLATANQALVEDPRSPEDLGPGDYVVLSVADDGVGMDEEVLAKSIEPFFTTKEVGKGSGLGLAQVYGFARQSGGSVRIVSAPGCGTMVSIYLPRVASPAEAATARAADVESAATLRNHVDDHGPQTEPQILLVDDDDAVREVTAALLREVGYRVTETASGAEALALFDRGLAIDLIVVDFVMPGMNGAEFARAVALRDTALPILFMTGYAGLGQIGEHRGNNILQKPFRCEDLVAKIESALRERAARGRPSRR